MLKSANQNAQNKNQSRGAHSETLCQHAQICSVCPWIDLSYEEQRNRKVLDLAKRMKAIGLSVVDSEIVFYEVAPFYIRDRVDFTIQGQTLGFYMRDSREIFTVESCPQMSPQLAESFQKLTKLLAASESSRWNIAKGSLRLRVSWSDPSLQGLWLDFANADIAKLLENEIFLDQLTSQFKVEIGQKHKSLQKVASQTKNRSYTLGEPELQPWTRTWMGEKEILLHSTAASFSQAGDLAVKKISQVIQGWFADKKYQTIIEFGAGVGTLTFPFLQYTDKIISLEYDQKMAEALYYSYSQAKIHAATEIGTKHLEVVAGDFQKGHELEQMIIKAHKFDLAVVNPPRSGLKDFVQLFSPQKTRPQEIFYMSCHADSFAVDVQKLNEFGYELKKIAILDQFPQTAHYEILSLWKLRS